MFGFILPNLESLDEAERSRYRGVYCGVCRSIEERFGQRSRLTVSYDMTFVALVLGSLYEPAEDTGSKPCLVHPRTPQDYARTRFTDYAADIGVALAYHKCLDDWRDDRAASRRAAALALAGPYRKARRLRPAACASIEATLSDIHEIERAAREGEEVSPDAAANCFGALLGDLFVVEDDFWATDLRRFGARLGKFVYVMDAAIDLEEDRKTGSYNPLVSLGMDRAATRSYLELLAAGMTDAFERLPLERDVHLLRSVLYAGVWQRYNEQEGNGTDDG